MKLEFSDIEQKYNELLKLNNDENVNVEPLAKMVKNYEKSIIEKTLLQVNNNVTKASKILKTPLKEKVSGFDLAMNLLKEYSGKNVSFYILGGQPGVPDMAAVNIISNYGKVKIAGYNHGYFNAEDEDDLIEKINMLMTTKSIILMLV